MRSAIKSYFCNVKGYDRENGYGSTVAAQSGSKARYRYYLDALEWHPDLKLIDVQVRSEGRRPVEPEGFRDCIKRRGVPFVCIGMRVIVNGVEGYVVGHNYSANLNVEPTNGNGVVMNCHPTWNIAYYADNGSLIARYDASGHRVEPVAGTGEENPDAKGGEPE